MLHFKSKGKLKKTSNFFKNAKKLDVTDILYKYGDLGVSALRNNTPSESGETKESWFFKVEKNKNEYALSWYNSKETEEGTPIVILLQYGHATNYGQYIEGVDFINPAMKPVFDQIFKDINREVSKL